MFTSERTFIFVVLLFLWPSCYLTQVHYIHWNTSNPMFSSALPASPVIDVGVNAHSVHQANIICPLYAVDAEETETEAGFERLVVYNVSRDEFEHCKLVSANPRAVAVCDRPTQPSYFTITFRPYSPTPGGFEFAAGLDYYFISTSSDKDINARSGGYCKSHNLRLVFRMLKEDEIKQRDSQAPKEPQEPQELLQMQQQQQQPRAFPDWSDTSVSSAKNKTQTSNGSHSPQHSIYFVIFVALLSLRSTFL